MVKDVCEIKVVNDEAVAYVKKRMLPEKKLSEIADSLKLFNDLSRLKILYAVSIKELCVCDISCLLNISPSAVSHQLRVLRQAKIVKYRKDGKIVYYSLADDNAANLLKRVITNVE